MCNCCKCKGHSKEYCYKLVGFPPNFKSKKKAGSTNYSGTHMVNTNHVVGQEQSVQKAQANFMYGMNVTRPNRSWIYHNPGGSYSTKDSQFLKSNTITDSKRTAVGMHFHQRSV